MLRNLTIFRNSKFKVKTEFTFNETNNVLNLRTHYDRWGKETGHQMIWHITQVVWNIWDLHGMGKLCLFSQNPARMNDKKNMSDITPPYHTRLLFKMTGKIRFRTKSNGCALLKWLSIIYPEQYRKLIMSQRQHNNVDGIIMLIYICGGSWHRTALKTWIWHDVEPHSISPIIDIEN